MSQLLALKSLKQTIKKILWSKVQNAHFPFILLPCLLLQLIMLLNVVSGTGTLPQKTVI